ncbi:MAG: 50S ribosomal protein L11 methyltransferase [Ignavibacteria bacterium]|nr:50S ribosomal protein L11 methyltransferase [Ignavibacteria bacterium]
MIGKNKNIYKIKIRYTDKIYENICNNLYMYGINSILEDDNEITVFLNSKKEADKLREILIRNTNLNSEDIRTEKFADRNWNDEWKKSLEPIRINNKFIIYPSWKAEEIKDEKLIKIQIDPKMSFGTGHNETTQLIIELMSKHISPADKKMIDFGCGTAILSIAAEKLGLKKITAIDIDTDAVINAQENIKVNDCSGIKILQCSISDIKENDFHIIAANLTSSVILDNLTEVKLRLKKGGKLFLSGILKEEKDEILNHLKLNHFKILEINDKGEWTAIYCVKQ